MRPPLSPAQLDAVRDNAAAAIDRLSHSKRIAKIKVDGVRYCAVRTFSGIQVQSADRRRLVANLAKGA